MQKNTKLQRIFENDFRSKYLSMLSFYFFFILSFFYLQTILSDIMILSKVKEAIHMSNFKR